MTEQETKSRTAAEQLADRLARELLEVGDERGMKCWRIAFMLGEYEKEEMAGGLCESALASWLARKLDDWQPLHPAADHAAEVKRLTAERDEARAACKREHNYYVAARSAFEREIPKAAALTARVAELEEELRDQGWMDSMCCCTGDCDHDSAHECLAWIRSQLDERCNSIREILATAPLPTAGDEGKTVGQKVVERLQDAVDEPDFAGMAARRMIEIAEREGKPGQSTSEAVMDWLGRQIDEIDEDPAEPDSPAEERDTIPVASVVLSQAIGNGGKGVHMRVPRETSTPPTVTISFKSERHAERVYREAVRLVDGVDPTDAAAAVLRETEVDNNQGENDG